MAKYNVLDSLKTAKMMKQIEASKLKIKESIKNQKSMNIKHARSISNIQIGINHKNSQEFKEGSVNFSQRLKSLERSAPAILIKEKSEEANMLIYLAKAKKFKLNQKKLFDKIAQSILGVKSPKNTIGRLENSKESAIKKITELSKATCLEPSNQRSKQNFSMNQFMMEAAISRKITEKLPFFEKKGHFLQSSHSNK